MKNATKLAIAATVAVIAGGVAVWSWSDLFLGTTVVRALQSATGAVPILVAIVAAAVGVFLLIRASYARSYRHRDHYGRTVYARASDEAARAAEAEAERNRKAKAKALSIAGATMLVVAAVGAVFAIKVMNRYGYEVNHRVAASVKVVNEQTPGYQIRTPYPRAVETMRRSLNDFRGGFSDPTYVVDGESASWCSYLSVSNWRRPLQGVICVDDTTGKATRVSFAGKVPSPNAKFADNLRRSVSHEARGSTFADADVYGYIADGEAHLVVPLKARSGWIHGYDVPAGVVTYDHDGNAMLVRNVAEGSIPGPVFPISLAEDLRQSLGSRGTFRDHYLHKLSFQDTSVAAESDDAGAVVDALDPNAGNTTEFGLRKVDGGGHFVSALSPYGRSTSVVAVASVPSNANKAGAMPTLTVRVLPTPRQTNGDVVSTIVSRYGLTIPFADDTSAGGNSQKFRVMEVTPGPDPKRWVVTIGLPARSVYRIEADAAGATCVYSANGDKLRCDAADVVTVPAGALTGVAGSESPTGNGGPAPAAPSGELVAVPVDQLIAERNRIQAELDRRAAGK